MEKLVVIYVDKETSKVTRVDIKFPPAITEEKLTDLVEKYNNRESERCRIDVKKLDDITYEAVKFLCGEEGYQTTYDLSNLKDWFTELKERIEDLDNARSDVEYDIRQLIKKIEEKTL